MVSKPKIPPAPPPPETPDPIGFRSEITGVERIPVEGPDGKTTIVEKQILTPEQQEEQDNLDRIQAEQLARVEQLTNNFEVDDIPGLRDTLTAFRDTNLQILRTGVNEASRVQEESLARIGKSDSTSAVQGRVALAREAGNARERIAREEQLLEQDIRNREISNALTLFGTAAGRSDVLTNQGAQALARGAASDLAGQQLQQQRNLAVFNSQLQQQQLAAQAAAAQSSALGGILSGVGTIAGAAVGGPFGAALGGSLFGSSAGTALGGSGSFGGGFGNAFTPTTPALTFGF